MNIKFYALFILSLVPHYVFCVNQPIAVVDGLNGRNTAVDILSDGPLVLCAEGFDVVSRDFDNTIISRYEGHDGTINTIVKNNNTCFATGSGDGTVRIWDARIDRSVTQLNFGHFVTQVSWGLAGNHLVGFDYNDRGLLWDVRQNRLLRVFNERVPGGSSISSATITPNAKKVILGYMVNAETISSKVLIHDVNHQQEPCLLLVENNGADIFEVKVNPSGRYLAIGDAANDVYLVDMLRYNKIRKLRHSIRPDNGLAETVCAFDGDSSGSKYIAAAGFPDGEIAIWALGSSERGRILKSPSRAAAIAWCTLGKYIVTAHADGKNRVWAIK